MWRRDAVARYGRFGCRVHPLRVVEVMWHNCPWWGPDGEEVRTHETWRWSEFQSGAKTQLRQFHFHPPATLPALHRRGRLIDGA